MTAPSLTDFLLARLDEDEAAAKNTRWLALEYGVDSYGQEAFAARVLADVEAKRRIVAKAQRADEAFAREINPATSAASFALTEVLHYLALPHADHPDYQEAWKP